MEAAGTAPSSNGRHRDAAKGKPAGGKAKAGERFAVLNAFVDFALAGLSRADVAVWLVLYRDTRDGTARTSYDDIARRAGLNRRNVGRAVRRPWRRWACQPVLHRLRPRLTADSRPVATGQPDSSSIVARCHECSAEFSLRSSPAPTRTVCLSTPLSLPISATNRIC